MPFPDEDFARKARMGELDAPPLPGDKQERTSPHGDKMKEPFHDEAESPPEEVAEALEALDEASPAENTSKSPQELAEAIAEVNSRRKTSLSVQEAREQEQRKADQRHAQARQEAIVHRADKIATQVKHESGLSAYDERHSMLMDNVVESLCLHIARIEFEMSDVKTVADHADFMNRPIG